MSGTQPTSVQVREVRIATAVAFGPAPHRSGIDKRAVAGPVRLCETGLEGDEQGDRRHHGGAEKALHHYAFEHYAVWRDAHPELAWRLRTAGAFGENIVTRGVDETNVCVGDIFAWGEARIQVSQARQPCWRLNVRFDQRQMARWVQQSGRTGWYYRVLKPGLVEPGQRLALVERPEPDWPLAKILHYFYVEPLNEPALQAIARLSSLTHGWRELAQRRLQRASVEDWHRRIDTPRE